MCCARLLNYWACWEPRVKLGRLLMADEDKPGKAPVALLSARLWQRRLGSDAQIVGKSITLDGNQFTPKW